MKYPVTLNITAFLLIYVPMYANKFSYGVLRYIKIALRGKITFVSRERYDVLVKGKETKGSSNIVIQVE
jgi:hypothetical protein